jgi:hypothetical protein
MRVLSAILLLASTVLVVAQTAPKPVFVQSLRKGSSRIAETKLQVSLDMKTPSYKLKIKDASKRERFVFALTPARADAQDKTILAWEASLEDVQHHFYGNLLLPTRDPYLNEGPAGKAARIDANPYAIVPLEAERVFKVDNFYCIIRVAKHHSISPQRWQLDAVDLDVQFTNTNPMTDTAN